MHIPSSPNKVANHGLTTLTNDSPDRSIDFADGLANGGPPRLRRLCTVGPLIIFIWMQHLQHIGSNLAKTKEQIVDMTY